MHTEYTRCNKISGCSLFCDLNLTPWPESARKLYRPSDRRLSAKLVPTFADSGSHVISVTDPYSRILGFLDWSRYFFFQVAPQYTETYQNKITHTSLNLPKRRGDINTCCCGKASLKACLNLSTERLSYI
jgi:hypothetical protein